MTVLQAEFPASKLNTIPIDSGIADSQFTSRQRHVPELDGLRALAVLGVMAWHWLGHWMGTFQTGRMGVRLFFVLSGFLITGILLHARNACQAKKISRGRALRQFYARRVLRIFPLYYLVLLIIILVNLPLARATMGWNFLYASNLYSARLGVWPESMSHLWSLSVEEQFYLFWPFLVMWLPRRGLAPTFITITAVGPLARALIWHFTRNDIATEVLMPCCFDALGIGALLAWCLQPGTASPSLIAWYKRLCLLIGVPSLLIGLFWTGGGVMLVLQSLGIALTGGWMIAALVTQKREGGWTRFLSLPPLTYLGTISYGLYLIHGYAPNLVRWLTQTLHITLTQPIAIACLRFAVTTVLAAISWHVFERPINSLKRYVPMP